VASSTFERCPLCAGSGFDGDDPCIACRGSGRHTDRALTIDARLELNRAPDGYRGALRLVGCEHCQGQQVVLGQVCEHCDGLGEVAVPLFNDGVLSAIETVVHCWQECDLLETGQHAASASRNGDTSLAGRTIWTSSTATRPRRSAPAR
jgi:RecJ-like exonuclease